MADEFLSHILFVARWFSVYLLSVDGIVWFPSSS